MHQLALGVTHSEGTFSSTGVSLFCCQYHSHTGPVLAFKTRRTLTSTSTPISAQSAWQVWTFTKAREPDNSPCATGLIKILDFVLFCLRKLRDSQVLGGSVLLAPLYLVLVLPTEGIWYIMVKNYVFFQWTHLFCSSNTYESLFMPGILLSSKKQREAELFPSQIKLTAQGSL